MSMLTEIYDEMEEEIYLKYNIVNIDNVKKRQEDLFALNDYLPLLIRSFCDGYFTRMEKNDVLNEVFEKMRKVGKYQSRKSSVNEFIDWIGEHKEFEELLKENNLKKMQKELSDLDKDFEKIMRE